MHGERQQKMSSGVVVVHCLAREFHYLLLRVYRNWDFPKGLVEPDELPLVAAKREVREETGLVDLEFRWEEPYIETDPYAGGKVARYYIAYSPSPTVTLLINPVLGRAEHHGYRWVTYDAARPLVVPRVATVLEWAHKIIGKHC